LSNPDERREMISEADMQRDERVKECL
jgi:hypothetical protein